MNYTLEELELFFEIELEKKGFERAFRQDTLPSLIAEIAYELLQKADAEDEVSSNN